MLRVHQDIFWIDRDVHFGISTDLSSIFIIGSGQGALHRGVQSVIRLCTTGNIQDREGNNAKGVDRLCSGWLVDSIVI